MSHPILRAVAATAAAVAVTLGSAAAPAAAASPDPFAPKGPGVYIETHCVSGGRRVADTIFTPGGCYMWSLPVYKSTSSNSLPTAVTDAIDACLAEGGFQVVENYAEEADTVEFGPAVTAATVGLVAGVGCVAGLAEASDALNNTH